MMHLRVGGAEMHAQGRPLCQCGQASVSGGRMHPTESSTVGYQGSCQKEHVL